MRDRERRQPRVHGRARSRPGRWGFDSFEPLPDLTELDAKSGALFVGLNCAGPEGEAAVPATFARLGVPMDRVHIVKGWFDDTLPSAVDKIGPIALLRLDADWYEATRFALETLYDSVVPSGVVVIDDYGSFRGCRRAVDEFREQPSVASTLHPTPDTVEAYWFASRINHQTGPSADGRTTLRWVHRVRRVKTETGRLTLVLGAMPIEKRPLQTSTLYRRLPQGAKSVSGHSRT